MKIMSVDYGDARTGIAFCDKNEILATAFATINESYQPKLIEKIKEIISSQNPEMIVIGLPRNMDGSYGFRCEKCKQLGEELKKEIQNHVKRVTAPYKYPRLIEFVDEIPETISGKIRRVEIRNNDNKKE